MEANAASQLRRGRRNGYAGDPMHLRAVAFDIDGTLYPNRIMLRRSVGFGIRHARLLFHFAKVRKTIRATRPIEDFYRLQARLMADALGCPEDVVRAKIQREIYDRWELVLRRVPLYDQVSELIDDLEHSGLRLAVMSDFPVARKLELLGLDGRWDCAISTEQVGYLKPNPEPFETLVACLEVSASEILYVGNSYEYDVVGASRAGLRTAWLNDRDGTDNRARSGIQPDFTFSHYRELRTWLAPHLTSEGRSIK